MNKTTDAIALALVIIAAPALKAEPQPAPDPRDPMARLEAYKPLQLAAAEVSEADLVKIIRAVDDNQAKQVLSLFADARTIGAAADVTQAKQNIQEEGFWSGIFGPIRRHPWRTIIGTGTAATLGYIGHRNHWGRDTGSTTPPAPDITNNGHNIGVTTGDNSPVEININQPEE